MLSSAPTHKPSAMRRSWSQELESSSKQSNHNVRYYLLAPGSTQHGWHRHNRVPRQQTNPGCRASQPDWQPQWERVGLSSRDWQLSQLKPWQQWLLPHSSHPKVTWDSLTMKMVITECNQRTSLKNSLIWQMTQMTQTKMLPLKTLLFQIHRPIQTLTPTPTPPQRSAACSSKPPGTSWWIL